MGIIKELTVTQITGIIAAFLVVVIITLIIIISHMRKKITKIKFDAKESAEENKKAFLQEKDILIANNNAEISALKLEYEKRIQEVKETIDKRRDVLANKSEKNLIIDVINALDGQNDKLDRIEKVLYSDQFGKQLEDLKQSFISELGRFSFSVNDQVDQLCERLNNTDVISAISNIGSGINDINDSVSSIESDVEEIKTSICDKYSYDSLASNISSLESEIISAREAAESAKEEAESARWAAEQLQYNNN
ncbi:hypothetical protein [Butyrivibrio sp. INlla14]|uniref:hypothetical protein n=1 Tax=Butyrivibrio sp. INlla14 TaxID=1520808 RepID=UPI0008764D94|nr:hypothetical protein [Butyrivibrio sp. INlla14]SCY67845.1 hypothetical protein SAMN02910371_03350 [Butyrivibrio sp. INlla14]